MATAGSQDHDAKKDGQASEDQLKQREAEIKTKLAAAKEEQKPGQVKRRFKGGIVIADGGEPMSQGTSNAIGDEKEICEAPFWQLLRPIKWR